MQCLPLVPACNSGYAAILAHTMQHGRKLLSPLSSDVTAANIARMADSHSSGLFTCTDVPPVQAPLFRGGCCGDGGTINTRKVTWRLSWVRV